MPKCVLLVGPPGSGKSTLAKKYVAEGFERFNQDEQGRGHLHEFDLACLNGYNVIIDRMNFNKQQRSRYLDIAKKFNYETEIVVLHENKKTCLARMALRENHPTIKNEHDAGKALGFFFKSYERVEDSEADTVRRIWPDSPKPQALICDLDGTLCGMEHRRKHLHREDGGKPDWKAFFSNMDKDIPNKWCVDLVELMSTKYQVVFCSGRPDDHLTVTTQWLFKHVPVPNESCLFMRQRDDHRKDDIVKEIILDFEILTRFDPIFAIDDRDQVVKMWRKRGITCLQCDFGDF